MTVLILKPPTKSGYLLRMLHRLASTSLVATLSLFGSSLRRPVVLDTFVTNGWVQGRNELMLTISNQTVLRLCFLLMEVPLFTPQILTVRLLGQLVLGITLLLFMTTVFLM